MIKSNFFLKHKKMLIFLVVFIVLIIVGILISSKRSMLAFAKQNEVPPVSEYAEVQSGDISLTITGSGAISSSSTKNIVSEVSAKVEQLNIKVGDKVSEGDVLLMLDSSDLDSQIKEKEKSITSYRKNLNEYKEDITNLNVYSNVTGYVQNLKIEKDDSVSKNEVIFEILDTSYYELNVNLHYFEASPVNVGDKARMFLPDSFTYVEGEVVEVSNLRKQYAYGGETQTAIITIENPGYTLEDIEVREVEVITQNGTIIKAVEEEIYTIKLKETNKFKSPSSGTISSINISEGSYISNGMLLMTLENDDLYEKLSDVKQSLSDAYTDLSDLKENYSSYIITAPIDGKVTSLSVSEGDNLKNGSAITTLVNTNKLQFEISVDELDILKLEVGQKAKITIDAIEETETEPVIGYVSEIGFEGNNMNGVTSYPVTITFDGREDIMIGMNCTVEIIVQSTENALIVPVEAVNSRRNKYYVTLEDGTEKEVEIGIYDEDNIEIISGLSIGEKVKLPLKVLSTSTNTETEKPQMSGFMNGGGMMAPGGFTAGGNSQDGRGFQNGGGSMPGNRGGF